MGRYDRDVRLNDQSGDPITPGNPLPTTSGGGGGGGGTSQADKSTFTEGTTQMTPVGGVYNESLGADPSEDQAAAVRITAKRALHINVRSAAGVEIGTAAAPLRTDPTGTTAQPVTDNGGSLTVDDGGGSITVDGTVAATQSGSWTVTANAGTGIFSVATEVQSDFDTDGGTQSLSLIGLALPASGGAVVGGTATDPLRTDPTGTTAQPVTDNGGSLTVDDGGGSLTVDGTVAATQSGTWSVQLTDGSLTASVRNTGSNDSLNVAIVDGSGNQITSFGGGTQYTDGDTDASPTGTVAMWWDDGDDTVHAASPSDPMPVTVVSGGGGGMVDDSPFTPGSSTVVPMGAYVDDTGTDSVDEGDIGAPRMSATRLLYVTTFSGSPVAISDGGGTITVDGSVSVSGTVGVTQSTSPWVVGDGGGSLTVDGPLTDTELRATAVVVDASGTAVPVTDNGGSLTVDGTVAATQSGTWSVQLTDGSLTASVRNTGSNDSLNVAICDASGNQIVNFGSSPSDLVVTDTLVATNDTITIDCEGYNSIGGWLDPSVPTDLWVLQFEGTVDGVTWDIVYGYDYSASTGSWTNTLTQNFGGPPVNRFVVPCAGLKQFRLTVLIWFSGTLAATLRGTQGVVQTDPNSAQTVIVTSLTPGVSTNSLGKAQDGTPSPSDTGVAILGIRQNTPAACDAANTKYAVPFLDRLGQIRVNPRPDRLVSGRYAVATFRTLGNAASPQNLFTIENASGSPVLLALQRLEVSCTYTAVLTAVEPEAILSRSTALPTGGTTLTQGLIDTTETANAAIFCRGATASDGGVATAITATAGTFLQRQFLGRIHTAVGEVNSRVPVDMLVGAEDRKPLLLRSNQAILVQIVAAAAGSNLATNHYTVNAEFEVFTLP